MNTNQRWYVYTHHTGVNRKVSDAFASLNVSMEGEYGFRGDLEVQSLEDRVGTLPLWEVNRAILNALNNDRQARGKFTAFSQEGNGPIREFDPEKSRRLAFQRRKGQQPHAAA